MPKIAMPTNALRQPNWLASVPPSPIPITEPIMPPAMKVPVTVEVYRGGNMLMRMATPTLE
ncbi:hypothetical protein D9M69_474050 [compost metagenome]